MIELSFSQNFRLSLQNKTPFWFAQVLKLNSPAMQQKTNALLKNETEWNSRFKRKSTHLL